MHPSAPATGKLIHNLLCAIAVRVKNDRDMLLLQPQPILGGPSHLVEVYWARVSLFCSTSAAFRRISRTPLPTEPAERLLAQTYIFFGGWGDFFHLFLSYFPWNLGIFVENFFG